MQHMTPSPTMHARIFVAVMSVYMAGLLSFRLKWHESRMSFAILCDYFQFMYLKQATERPVTAGA